MLAGLDLEVLVTDDDQARHCALLLALLEHLQGHGNLADLSLSIIMDQLHIDRVFTEQTAQLSFVRKKLVCGE